MDFLKKIHALFKKMHAVEILTIEIYDLGNEMKLYGNTVGIILRKSLIIKNQSRTDQKQ